jgi:hypothetical protein
MRRLQSKLKERRKVPIPLEFRDSLREVFELIQAAKNDPDIRLDYDDAIQVGAVCGGCYGKNPRPYVLTYYPTGDSEKERWFLTLHKTEIEDISDGRMTEISMNCCISAECRYKFRETDEHCFDCDYFDDPDFGTFDFPLAMERLIQRGISSISQTSTLDDVLEVLGQPDEAGGNVPSSIGYIWPWIRYRGNDCQIRFEFDKEMSSIRNISVIEKDWKPGQ